MIKKILKYQYEESSIRSLLAIISKLQRNIVLKKNKIIIYFN